MTKNKLRPLRKRKQEESMRERGYIRLKGSRKWVKSGGLEVARARVAALKKRRGG